MLIVKTACALVEIGGSHDECILAQLMALKTVDAEITLVCTQAIRTRNPFFEPYVDHWKELSFNGKGWSDFKLMWKLNRFFKEKHITHVILNTAQGAHIRNLCLTASRKVTFIGIVHTLKKFQGSGTQRIIHRKIKKYFVLNNYFKSRITPPKGIRIEAFYPLRFPQSELEQTKADGEYWVTIIGGVENRRKDLTGSLSLMKACEQLPIKFIFLGKSDPTKQEVQTFKTALAELGLEERVVLMDDFVPFDVFDSFLRKTDLIWPMVHPKTPSSSEYLSNQISGAMNVAFGYKIPLLVHEKYTKRWPDLGYAVAYRRKTFVEDLKQGLTNLPEYQVYTTKLTHLNPEIQERDYLTFIFD